MAPYLTRKDSCQESSIDGKSAKSENVGKLTKSKIHEKTYSSYNFCSSDLQIGSFESL